MVEEKNFESKKKEDQVTNASADFWNEYHQLAAFVPD